MIKSCIVTVTLVLSQAIWMTCVSSQRQRIAQAMAKTAFVFPLYGQAHVPCPACERIRIMLFQLQLLPPPLFQIAEVMVAQVVSLAKTTVRFVLGQGVIIVTPVFPMSM